MTSFDTAQTTYFEDLLIELSAAFVNVSPDELDERIIVALRRIVLFLGIDRSTVAQFEHISKSLRVTHSWAVTGIEPLPLTLGDANFPYLAELTRAGKPFVYSRLTDMPAAAHKDREFAQRIGLKSVAVVPLNGAGEILGVLAFGAIRREREWPLPFVQRLQLIGEVFANALLQRQRERDLNKALAEVSALKERLEAENIVWREQAQHGEPTTDFIGDSPAFRGLLQQIELVAQTDSTVLILGETGTGKELVATAIHRQSRRADQPLIRVNCAALPADLIESELFGHEKGAFTGALMRKIGRFELAHGGTIVLDEIGELPGALQAKLLRVLQSGEFERLGSTVTQFTDARLIASTNRDLKTNDNRRSVSSGSFLSAACFPHPRPSFTGTQRRYPFASRFFC